MSCTVVGMTPRKLHTQSIYLEMDRAQLLDELAAETRIAKAVLLREAVDDLLTKYGKLKKQTKPKK
jgi:predicted DNA-binding protein